MALSLVDLLQIDFTYLGTTLEANVEWLLPALVRLSSHGCFVGLKLAGGNDNAVDGDDKTILKVHNVTDVQVVHMDGLLERLTVGSVASHSHLI